MYQAHKTATLKAPFNIQHGLQIAYQLIAENRYIEGTVYMKLARFVFVAENNNAAIKRSPKWINNAASRLRARIG